MAAIRLVAFDLDGTLADSLPDIVNAVDDMACELGLPRPSIGRVREWVGDGTRQLVKRVLTETEGAEPEASRYEQALQAFRHAYHAHLAAATRLYPDVVGCLQWLGERSYTLACITNKASEFTEPLLEALGIRAYFGAVLSGDSLVRSKPDPLPLLHAARQFRIASPSACMVGDSKNDILAAQAAGFRAVGVAYGYGNGLAELHPDAVLGSLVELPALLDTWATGVVPVPANGYV